MAGRARGLLPVLLEPLAHGGHLATLTAFRQRRHVRRGRRRRRAQEAVEKEPPAEHRRCSIWIGRGGQETALTQQAATRFIALERDPPKSVSDDVRDLIV